MFTYSLLFHLQGRAFLRWSRYEIAHVVWQEITARVRRFLPLLYHSLEPTDYYRRKRQSSARSSSLQGTGVSRAIRSAALAIPPREGWLPGPGAVAVSPHREALSPHRTVTRPSGPLSVISASAIQTSSRAISSFGARPTLAGGSLACSTGNTPASCPRFSLPAYPHASRITMILSRNL